MGTMLTPSTPGLPLLALTCRNAAFRFSRSHTASINRFVLAGFSVPLIAPDDSVSSLPASRASPVSAEEKSSSIWIFCCLSSLRLMTHWPLLLVRAFGHRFRLGLSIRSEEHTSELQSLRHLVCRLLLEKKKKKPTKSLAVCSTVIAAACTPVYACA